MEHSYKILMKLSVLCILLFGLLVPNFVFAGENDLRLSRLCPNGQCDQAVNDFKQLSRNISTVMEAGLFQPASTLGQEGFEIGVESRLLFAKEDSSWKVLNKYKGAAAPANGKYAPPDLFSTLQIHVRKGLPFSFELEAIINWLVKSEMFYAGAGLKWAITEGWSFLPDFAVRSHVGILFGSVDLSLVNVSVDGVLSYNFGLGGVVTLTPYAAYSLLISIASSRPFLTDAPGTNETQKGVEQVFSRKTQLMHRGLVGLELRFVNFMKFGVEGEFGKEMMGVGLKLGTIF